MRQKWPPCIPIKISLRAKSFVVMILHTLHCFNLPTFLSGPFSPQVCYANLNNGECYAAQYSQKSLMKRQIVWVEIITETSNQMNRVHPVASFLISVISLFHSFHSIQFTVGLRFKTNCA